MSRFEPHSHTMYSNIRFLDSINKPTDLIDRAVELGLSGIAITDHGCLCALPEAYKYVQEKILPAHPDFKFALGDESYLVDKRDKNIQYYHFILIAKDKIGWRMLRELSSYSWMQSYFDRGMERVPTTKEELVSKIKKYGKGHLIASSACLAGEVNSNVLDLTKAEKAGNQEKILELKGNIDKFIRFCIDCFGDDFYLECAPGTSADQIAVNRRLPSIAKAYNRKIIIGTDAHYLKKGDRNVHKGYLNSKQAEREVDSFYEFAYLQSEEEIKENIKPSGLNYSELVHNSEEIYNKIQVYEIRHKQQIPTVDVKDYPKKDALVQYHHLHELYMSDDKQNRYWVNQCVDALKDKKLYNDIYLKRLDEEADVKQVIGEKLETNMFSYPVTLQHYVDMFWECDSTIGAGRGSSCSGLNHYLLGVTQLDPIRWNLPFFRYLNKERVELGDIDIDISPSRRPEILRRIKVERGAHFNSEIDDLSRQNLGCTLVATFGTESTRSTVLSACRGYRSEDFPKGIDVDEAQYMSSLIPQERGFVWDLEDVVYGNQDKGREPVTQFVDEVNNYPGLLDIMFGIQGLVKQRGSHASGVIFFDKDPYEFAAFMKTPSGDIITQWDLEMDEMLGMTKFDFLVTDVQDKIVTTIKLLQRNKEINPSLSLRQVYEKYLSPDVLPLDDSKIWDALDNGTVLNVFQFDSQVGSQAAKKICPRTVEEMSDANGLLRLMTQEKGAESPMDKYVRFKRDISLWYKEMDAAGLTKAEQKTLEPYFKSSYGVPPSQEQLMLMLMDPNICHFSLKEANDARKIVGKKQMNRIPTLHQKVLDQAKSPALGKYVWEYGAGPQMGYSFSRIHSIAYSFVGVQTLYLATHFNPIYWDCACLIVNSGAISGGSPNYAKIAKAIGEIQSAGVKVALVDINKSDLTFTPNPTNNTIIYGLKGILNVGDDIVQDTINKRPYTSIKDYYNKVHPNKQAMISLIKGGAFDTMEDRKFAMAWFIWETCDKKKKLTLSNMAGLIKHNLLPENTDEEKTARRVFEFNRYLKKVCADSTKTIYTLDSRALEFLTEMGYDNLIQSDHTMFVKDWNTKYQEWMGVLRDWLNKNQEEILNNLNYSIFMEDWNKYAQGTYSDWEMAALCFYYHPHVLMNVNNERYGFADFAQLPKDPVIEDTYNIRGHTINIFKISRLAGTCIAKDKMHHTISLLTTTGVVNVKFVKDQFAYFDKQISQRNPDGTKTVIEKSWFTRGNLLIVQGIRSGDTFMCKKYSRTPGHRLAKITRVNNDNSLEIQEERAQGDYEDEE